MDKRTKEFYVKLGSNLRKARKSKGYTLAQVSKMLGRGVATISDNERGVTEIPFSIIMEYCRIYNVDISEITPDY